MIRVRYEAGRYIFQCALCGHRISWVDDTTRLARLLCASSEGTSSAERCEHCGRLLAEPPYSRYALPYKVHENDNGTFDVYDMSDARREESMVRMLPTRLEATIWAEMLAIRHSPDVLYRLYNYRKRRGDLLGY